MKNFKAWDFLREDPVEKTIFVDRELLLKPLEDPREIYEYTGEIDLFDDKVPTAAISAALAVMLCAPQSRFLVATVFPDGAREYLRFLRPHLDQIKIEVDQMLFHRTLAIDFRRMDFVPNLAIGASVSDQATADERLASLLSIPAACHFANHAPASGPIDWTELLPDMVQHSALKYRLDALRGIIKFADGRTALEASGQIDWILVGGSGRGFVSQVHPDWIRQASRQCLEAGIPFAFTSWGKMMPGDQVQVEPLPEAGISGPTEGSWARSVTGGDVEAGPVEFRGYTEEQIADLRSFHEKRAGAFTQIARPGGQAAKIVANPKDPADPTWEMVEVDLSTASAFPPILDGEQFFELPDFFFKGVAE